MPATPSVFITPAELAACWHLSRSTVYERLATGHLPYNPARRLDPHLVGRRPRL